MYRTVIIQLCQCKYSFPFYGTFKRVIILINLFFFFFIHNIILVTSQLFQKVQTNLFVICLFYEKFQFLSKNHSDSKSQPLDVLTFYMLRPWNDWNALHLTNVYVSLYFSFQNCLSPGLQKKHNLCRLELWQLMMWLASVFNNNTEALYNVDSDNNNVLSDKKKIQIRQI